MPIIFQTTIKPTPSIGQRQRSVKLQTMQEEERQIVGRHDACMVMRAIPGLEAVANIALLDAWKGADIR